MKTAKDKRQDDARSDRKVRIFISYSRKQMEWVESLAAAIEVKFSAQIECRFDKRDLPYGEEWQNELDQMIRWADAVVFAVSPSSILSKWCRWELSRVTLHSKRLIPMQIVALEAGQEQPPEIGAIQVIPAFDRPFDDSLLETLANTALSNRAWITTHTRLAELAAAWVGDGSKDRLLRGSALRHAEAWRASRPHRAPEPSKEQLDYIAASESAAKRRGWRLTGALAFVAVLLLLLGTALVANDQRLEARKQEGIAQDKTRVAQNQTVIAEKQSAAASAAAEEEAKARRETETQRRFAVAAKDGETVAKLAAQQSATDAKRRLAALLKDKAHEAWRADKRDEALAYMVEAYGAGAQEPGDRLMLGSMAASYSQAISRLPAMGLEVAYAALSDAGDRLLVCGKDRTARVWAVRERREIASFRPGGGRILGCQISPDGKRALTHHSGGEDVTVVRIWNTDNGLDLDRWTTEIVTLAFTRDSNSLLELDQTGATRRDGRTGRSVGALFQHEDMIISADLETGSGRMLSASGKSVKLTAANGVAQALPAPAVEPKKAFFSAQGPRLVGNAGGQLLLVDPRDGRRVAVLIGSQPEPTKVHLSTDRTRIAARTPQALVLWDAATGVELGRKILELTDNVAAFDAGMTRVLVAGAKRLSLYDIVSDHEIGSMDCPRCDDSRLSGDGSTVATFQRDSLPTVWALDKSAGKTIVKARGPAGEPAPEHLAAFDEQMVLRLKSAGPTETRCELLAREVSDDPQNQSMEALLACRPTPASQVFPYFGNRLMALPVLSGDGRALALPNGPKNRSSYNEPHVYQRIGDRFELKRQLLGLKAYTNSMAFDSKATQLLATSGNEALIWHVATGDLTTRLEGHTERIAAAAFDSSDHLVATVADDKTLRIWSRATGRQLASIKTPAGFQAVAFDRASPAQLTAWLKTMDGPQRYEVTMPYETRPYEELKRWAEKVSPFAIVDGVAVPRSGFGASEAR